MNVLLVEDHEFMTKDSEYIAVSPRERVRWL